MPAKTCPAGTFGSNAQNSQICAVRANKNSRLPWSRKRPEKSRCTIPCVNRHFHNFLLVTVRRFSKMALCLLQAGAINEYQETN
jgi:hypothetical protein